MKFFSSVLDQKGRASLRDDVTIVPVGGLDKLATFVALLGGNQLEIAVLSDFESKSNARLESLVREKLIRDRHVLHYGMFRNAVTVSGRAKKSDSESIISSDIEDMISPNLYLKLFNGAYKKELSGKEIKEIDLPPGDRIVERIGRFLKSNSIQLKQSGGYNHYLVANYLASNPIAPSRVDTQTLSRFEKLFEAVNPLYSEF